MKLTASDVKDKKLNMGLTNPNISVSNYRETGESSAKRVEDIAVLVTGLERGETR